MEGLLLVDKPKSWTSFDVVAKIRGMLRAEANKLAIAGKIKVGHTGTLDPMATGLLVLAIGSYTKKVPELTKQDKTYIAQIELGCTSETDDNEGVRIHVSDRVPTQEEITATLNSFIGTIAQVPPQFSAIKVGGVRAYASARKGKEVALQPREVVIHAITDVTYAYPFISFRCDVGSGTYIRSLARDIGQQLGVGAYLSELRRTQVGTYTIDEAVPMESITTETIRKNLLA